MKQLSRRQLAQVLLDYTKSHGRKSSSEIAAYLIAEKREREIDAILREMERLNEEAGEVTVYVKTARPINSQTENDIRELVKSHVGSKKTITISEEIQQDLTGGIVIDFAGKSVDLSVRGKLDSLAAANRKEA